MVNPYFCYVFSFVVALITYTLGWSDLYPPLSLPLLLFLTITIIVFFVLGVITMKTKIINFRKIGIPNHIYPLFVTLFIYLLWSVEFFYEGGIPLFKILLKQPYDYRLFGVPSLHVFVVTFSSFYTIYLFHHYLSQRSLLLLTLYGINLIAALLIYNRGMLFFNLSASAFLYLIYKRRLSFQQIMFAFISVIILLFFFGALGSLRDSRLGGKSYSNKDFLQTGSATESIRKSIIPDEFFWSYIYISSPLANLQTNINTYSRKSITVIRIFEWAHNEILFDFISKRINSVSKKVREGENTIPGPFNVSTVYSRSYSYLGWAGLILMCLIIIIIPILFLKILPTSSPFFLTGLAILNTIFLYMVFDNTLRFTGLSFQLVYPVLLHIGVQRLQLLKKIF